MFERILFFFASDFERHVRIVCGDPFGILGFILEIISARRTIGIRKERRTKSSRRHMLCARWLPRDENSERSVAFESSISV